MQCKVSSDPSVPYNIDWYREGQPTAIMNSQRIGVQADGTLEISAVRAADVGVYSCMVSIIFLELLLLLRSISKKRCFSSQTNFMLYVNRLRHLVEMRQDRRDYLFLNCHFLQQMLKPFGMIRHFIDPLMFRGQQDLMEIVRS